MNDEIMAYKSRLETRSADKCTIVNNLYTKRRKEIRVK